MSRSMPANPVDASQQSLKDSNIDVKRENCSQVIRQKPGCRLHNSAYGCAKESCIVARALELA